MADSNSENNQIIIDADIAFSDESECSDIERSAAEAIEKTLPKKSKLNYEKVYKKFCGWCEEKRVKVISENVMLCYFNEKSKIMKSSTVWSEYSKLKCMIYKERRVDISKFHGLIAFLKRNGVGHVAKKSSILTGDDFNKFIMEADDDKFLMMKAALIIGIGGGCRRAELAKMSVKDVVDRGDYLHVYIGDTKNYDPRDFAITEGGLRYNLLGIVRKYMLLRKSHTPHDRFFVCYRNGQCTTQAVGINTIGAIPKRIATFCGLDAPALYTGHCFRRSSATLLADAGADLYVIKRQFGWRSDKVAAGYVQSSATSKRKISAQIFGGVPFQRSSSSNAMSAIPSTSNTAIPSTSNTAIPSTSTTAIPSASNTVFPSTSTTAIPSASNTVFPSTSTTSHDVVANLGDSAPKEINLNITGLSDGISAALIENIDREDAHGASFASKQIRMIGTASDSDTTGNTSRTMSQSITIIEGASAGADSSDAPETPVLPNFTKSEFNNCTFNFYRTFHGKPF
ncbi:uncharacterized protein LOC119084937 [Bradysia coprophila]|uniref:uncharacterized protein LOC119084937 n=1 Tax=Bradysia coprophila TaxID=38358 RepID=UPI00187D6F16|nr:uncharacterized protein LOC119084937 [Bradysia coprophila]